MRTKPLFRGEMMVDGSVSELSEEYCLEQQHTVVVPEQDAPNVEVTHEEHLQQVSGGRSSPVGARVARRLTNLIQHSRRPKSKSSPNARGAAGSQPTSNNTMVTPFAVRSAMDTQSVGSDNATTQSVEGIVSVSNFTVGSHDTVKASNKSARSLVNKVTSEEAFSSRINNNKTNKRWGKIKRMIGVRSANTVETSSSADPPPPEPIRREHSFSADHVKQFARSLPVLNRRRLSSGDASKLQPVHRVRSTPTASSTGVPSPNQQQQAIMDCCIRGRLDGFDVLSLGPAQTISLPSYDSPGISGRKNPWENIPNFSFTGRLPHETTARLVSTMLWTSGGRKPPEMILEGYIPGGDDRWSVRIEQRRKSQLSPSTSCSCSIAETTTTGATTGSSVFCGPTGRTSPGPPALTPAETEDYEVLSSEDGSPVMPTHKLWNKLWGSEPAPNNIADRDKLLLMDNNDNSDNTECSDDPLLNLAAECSIPIDIDEDTFIVSTREHMQSIHELAAVPLSGGRFEAANRIFAKLLKGLDLLQDDQKDLRFLRGATLHNIGVLQLWQGDFQTAATTFEEVVRERTTNLPQNHPDTAVSLVRWGMSLFALEQLEEALASFERAVVMLPVDSPSRAKVLNNIGVVRYQQCDYAAALKDFTRSLEIQRLWLDETVRREAIVYEAAVTLGNMGRLYLEQSDYDLAYYVYEESLLLQTTIFRKDHDIVLRSLTNLALAKAKSSQLKKALQILNGCLRSQNARFGPDNAPAVETIGLMGFLYARQKDFEEALRCFATVKKWQKNHLASNHPSIKRTKEMVRAVEGSIGTDVSVWI